jgi:hypothetical protein
MLGDPNTLLMCPTYSKYHRDHATNLIGHTQRLNRHGMRLSGHGNMAHTLPRYVNMSPRHGKCIQDHAKIYLGTQGG